MCSGTVTVRGGLVVSMCGFVVCLASDNLVTGFLSGFGVGFGDIV
jgi:hypothetical protein